MAQGKLFSICKEFLLFRKILIIILVPLILLPLPLTVNTDPARCGYALLIMAIYWTTEALPLAVTALLPMVLLPLLGVMSSRKLAINYLKDTNMLFVGGLLVAVAVEHWNLHKRIALRVLLIVGSKPRWLMLGFMSVTAFLSMWISNTATTAMMIPIVQAVLDQLSPKSREEDEPLRKTDSVELDPIKEDKEDVGGDTNHTGAEAKPDQDDRDVESGDVVIDHTQVGEDGQLMRKSTDIHDGDEVVIVGRDTPKGKKKGRKLSVHGSIRSLAHDMKNKREMDEFTLMAKGLTLCIPYAANVGGTATLTGTPPNLVMKGQTDTLFSGKAGITFGSWFGFAFPIMFVCLILCWCVLQFLFLGWRTLFGCCIRGRKTGSDSAAAVMRREYAKMGPMTFAEKVVLAHFVILALLWLTRDPGFVPGWGYGFKKGYVSDAVPAILIAVSLFICPSERPKFFCCRKKNDPGKPGPVPPILNWKVAVSKLPWNVILLLGGGFALADAVKTSGLSNYIGDQMMVFRTWPDWALCLMICIVVEGLTEVMSNTATATIFIPIVAQLAISNGINPLYLVLPVTLSTSWAFCLPVATPPNAIAFSYGNIQVLDMAKCGAFLHTMCIIVTAISINTWAKPYWHLDTFPEWAGQLPGLSPANATTLLGNATTLLANNTLPGGYTSN